MDGPCAAAGRGCERPDIRRAASGRAGILRPRPRPAGPPGAARCPRSARSCAERSRSPPPPLSARRRRGGDGEIGAAGEDGRSPPRCAEPSEGGAGGGPPAAAPWQQVNAERGERGAGSAGGGSRAGSGDGGGGRAGPLRARPVGARSVHGGSGGGRRGPALGRGGRSAARLRLRPESRSEGAFSSSLSDVPSASALGQRWRSGSRCSLPEMFDRAQLSLADLLARFVAWTCSVLLLIRFALADKARAKEKMGVPILAFCRFPLIAPRSWEWKFLHPAVSSPHLRLCLPPPQAWMWLSRLLSLHISADAVGFRAVL